MCGRFCLITPPPFLAEYFGLEGEIPEFAPRYNIAPTQNVAAVRAPAEGEGRRLALLHWGLNPFWAREPDFGGRLINARAETAHEKPAFREAFMSRRCLIPADGFYEWKKEGKAKRPFLVRLREQGVMAFAGLWERWEGGDDRVVESCTILTTQPNDLLAGIHNRMPVILDPKDFDFWLDPSEHRPDRLSSLLGPFPPEAMEAFPVGTFVGNPANEGPRCHEREARRLL